MRRVTLNADANCCFRLIVEEKWAKRGRTKEKTHHIVRQETIGVDITKQIQDGEELCFSATTITMV